MDKSNYKNIFVFVEQRDGVIQPVGLELLGKAHELAQILGEKVVAMFLGHNIKNQCQTLIEYGADEVVYADCPELQDYLTEQYSQAIAQISDKYLPNIILFGATTIGRDLGPRLSARLATGLVGTSMNKAAKALLASALGLLNSRRPNHVSDFLALAGAISDEEAAQMRESVAECRTIDWKDWQ